MKKRTVQYLVGGLGSLGLILGINNIVLRNQIENLEGVVQTYVTQVEELKDKTESLEDTLTSSSVDLEKVATISEYDSRFSAEDKILLTKKHVNPKFANEICEIDGTESAIMFANYFPMDVINAYGSYFNLKERVGLYEAEVMPSTANSFINVVNSREQDFSPEGTRAIFSLAHNGQKELNEELLRLAKLFWIIKYAKIPGSSPEKINEYDLERFGLYGGLAFSEEKIDGPTANSYNKACDKWIEYFHKQGINSITANSYVDVLKELDVELYHVFHLAREEISADELKKYHPSFFMVDPSFCYWIPGMKDRIPIDYVNQIGELNFQYGTKLDKGWKFKIELRFGDVIDYFDRGYSIEKVKKEVADRVKEIDKK